MTLRRRRPAAIRPSPRRPSIVQQHHRARSSGRRVERTREGPPVAFRGRDERPRREVLGSVHSIDLPLVESFRKARVTAGGSPPIGTRTEPEQQRPVARADPERSSPSVCAAHGKTAKAVQATETDDFQAGTSTDPSNMEAAGGEIDPEWTRQALLLQDPVAVRRRIQSRYVGCVEKDRVSPSRTQQQSRSVVRSQDAAKRVRPGSSAEGLRFTAFALSERRAVVQHQNRRQLGHEHTTKTRVKARRNTLHVRGTKEGIALAGVLESVYDARR